MFSAIHTRYRVAKQIGLHMAHPSWRNKFGAAFYGLYLGLITERSFQVHCVVALIVIAAGGYFRVTMSEWCLLILAMTIVLALELMNSAVEQLAKVITRESNPVIGAALDLAASAVLMATCGAVAIGCLIFTPYLWQLLFAH